MKKYWKIAGAACVLGAGLGVSAAGLQGDDGWLSQRANGMLVRRIERNLDLTEDQMQQIKTILRTERPMIQELAARVHEERMQLEAQPYDESAVRTFAQQHESTLEDVMVEREKIRAEIQQVLTPEQRGKAATMRDALYARFVNRLTTLGDQM